MKYQSDWFTKSVTLLFFVLLLAFFMLNGGTLHYDFFDQRNSQHFLKTFANVLFVLNFLALFLTIRDLYRRDFFSLNSKVTWLLLIVGTMGIGWLIYLFKYVFRKSVTTKGPSGPDADSIERSAVYQVDSLTRKVCKASVIFMLIYIPIFLGIFFYNMNSSSAHEEIFYLILIPHFTGMILNFWALILTFRDLYRREFPEPNSKLTWAILILGTGGIGWLVYVFRYILKREEKNEQPEQVNMGQST